MKFGGNGPAIVAPDIIGLRKDRPAYHLIRYRNGVGQREPGVAKHDFVWHPIVRRDQRSEEHTSELQSLMRISYAVFCLKKKTNIRTTNTHRSYESTKTTVH